MALKRSKEGKIQLPVDVRGSKTSVLKFPNKIFLLRELTFYGNHKNKFSFVLYTNMAAMQTTYIPTLICFRQRSVQSPTQPLFVSSRNAPPQWGGALRDETNNGCVGDYGALVLFPRTETGFSPVAHVNLT